MAAKTFYRNHQVVQMNGVARTLLPGLFPTKAEALATIEALNVNRREDGKYGKVLLEVIQGHEYTFKKVFEEEPNSEGEWVAEAVDESEGPIEEEVPTVGTVPVPAPAPVPAPPVTTNKFRVAFEDKGTSKHSIPRAPKDTLKACVDEIVAWNSNSANTPVVRAIIEEFPTFEVLIPLPESIE